MNNQDIITELSDSIEILIDIDTQDFSPREKQQLHESVIAAIRDAITSINAQEQIRWERDIAIGQLESIGKSLGQTMSDIWMMQSLYSPRVLTLEEYKAEAEKKREYRVPIWEEWITEKQGKWKIPQRAYEGYGTSWRVWTFKPSESQRSETPWNSSL